MFLRWLSSIPVYSLHGDMFVWDPFMLMCTHHYLWFIIADSLEFVPCKALDEIVESFKRASPDAWFCTVTEKCETATCTDSEDGQTFELTILKCNHPPSFRIVNKDIHGTVMLNHTFDHSEVFSASTTAGPVTINATLVQRTELLGIRVSTSFGILYTFDIIIMGNRNLFGWIEVM